MLHTKASCYGAVGGDSEDVRGGRKKSTFDILQITYTLASASAAARRWTSSVYVNGKFCSSRDVENLLKIFKLSLGRWTLLQQCGLQNSNIIHIVSVGNLNISLCWIFNKAESCPSIPSALSCPVFHAPVRFFNIVAGRLTWVRLPCVAGKKERAASSQSSELGRENEKTARRRRRRRLGVWR